MQTPNWIDQNGDGKVWFAIMRETGETIHCGFAPEWNTWFAMLWGPFIDPDAKTIQGYPIRAPITQEYGLRDEAEAKFCAENLWKAHVANSLHRNS